jgi:membrane protein YdbS with pleckstrin-like domain
MATDETSPVFNTTQVTTTDLTPVAGADAAHIDDLYPPPGPDPVATKPQAVAEMEKEEQDHQATGVEGEEVVWEGRYAMKNFVGRILGRAILTVAWAALAIFTWGYGHANLAAVTIVLGVALAAYWLALVYRMLMARFGHFYRLTTRRLFVSTGLMQRRRDQLGLLRVVDVYTRQDWFERLLSLGTVVVVSSEKSLPSVYLPGVGDPKRVMDLIWHYARSERDLRSVKVQEV